MTTAEALAELRRALDENTRVSAAGLAEIREAVCYLRDREKALEATEKRAADAKHTAEIATASTKAALEAAGVIAHATEAQIDRIPSGPRIDTRMSGSHPALREPSGEQATEEAQPAPVEYSGALGKIQLRGAAVVIAVLLALVLGAALVIGGKQVAEILKAPAAEHGH